MALPINRRVFLKGASATAAALAGAPLIRPARVSAAGERLVVAVGQWGIETPFAWRSSQSEKTLWDCMYDPLIMRDPKTFEYRPGLATEWKPSNELRTWTFKLRSGVQFQDGRLPYNLGHAAFEFIESKWGKEGLRQFLFALRKAVIGGGESAYEEAFRLKAEEFDEQFEKYLKDRFKPFRDKERPADYGRNLAPKRDKTPYSVVISIEPSPSGDLLLRLHAADMDAAHRGPDSFRDFGQ